MEVYLLIAVCLVAAGAVEPSAMANSAVIGPAINFTLQWTANVPAGSVSICVSAGKRISTDWIGIGFSSQAHNMMNASDIVVGSSPPRISRQGTSLPRGRRWCKRCSAPTPRVSPEIIRDVLHFLLFFFFLLL